MRYYRDSDEVFSYVGKMFEVFLRQAEYEERLRESGLVVRLNHTGPDCTLLVDLPNHTVYYAEPADGASRAPNVELHMSGNDAHRFWMGKLNLTVAMARRQVRVEGSAARAMKLLPLTQPLSALYRRLLEEAGRGDLIAAA